MKIAILGYSGAGKSTLAKKIATKYDIPLLHLDMINFSENWKERETNDVKEKLENFMDENESWVIDGNYSKLEQERRVKEADKIIFLDFPRWICLKRAYHRYKENKNRVREDVANGCVEKFDFVFVKWILIDGRDKKHKQRYNEICEKYKDKVIICRTEKEVLDLVKNI